MLQHYGTRLQTLYTYNYFVINFDIAHIEDMSGLVNVKNR